MVCGLVWVAAPSALPRKVCFLHMMLVLEPCMGRKYQAWPGPTRKRFGPARYTAEKYRPGPVQ